MNAIGRKLDFNLKNNYNVLLVSEAGFGKTAMIKQCFDRNNLNWAYFSAATMDPWVDFVGIPKEMVDEATGVTYLDLVRPKAFAFDQVEAIFFDEFNRAPAKVRNAALELIQFKSINGKKFNNLRVVWAAINPFDEEGTYNVEQLDPAQEDRFHVKIEVPNVPDLDFFTERFGAKRGQVAVDWWHAHSKESKVRISARRLEYAVDAFTKEGDVRDFLPKGANCSRLVTELSSGSILDRFKDVIARGDADELKKFLRSENNYTVGVEFAMKHQPNLVPRLATALNDERLVTFMLDHETVIPVLLKCANVAPFYNAFCVVVESPKISPTNARAVKAALSTRFPTQNSHEIQYYEVMLSSRLTNSRINMEIASAVLQTGGMPSMDSAQVKKIYDFMADNLSPKVFDSSGEALDAVCMCFRIIENTKPENINTTYPDLVGMLNTCLKFFLNPDGSEAFNSNWLMEFTRQPRQIRSTAKVQKFLDSAKLIYKPRLI